jgi:hypothetical protein
MSGCVAWIYDPDATNETSTNKSNDYSKIKMEY